MRKINRENLMANLNELKLKKEELKQQEFTYRIQRSWPGVGLISEIESPRELVNAHIAIHANVQKQKEAAEALNMLDGTFDEFTSKSGEETYYGHTIEEWDKELMTKRDELAIEVKLNKIDTAIDILTKNMSEEDKFNADMDIVDQLLG